MTTTTPQRIGGWLLGPLAWLLVALLSTTNVGVVFLNTILSGCLFPYCWQ